MGIANPYLSVALLTSYINDMNYNLMMVASKREAVVAKQSAIIQEYSERQTSQVVSQTNLISTTINNLLQDNDITQNDINVALNTVVNANANMDYSNWAEDPNYMLLHLQESNLDTQQKKYETSLKSATANLESQQKLLDNNTKQDFAPKLSI